MKRQLSQSADAWIETACQVLSIASADARASRSWRLTALVGQTHRLRITQGRADTVAIIEWIMLADQILRHMSDSGWPSMHELTSETAPLLRRLRISAKAQARSARPARRVRLTGYGIA